MNDELKKHLKFYVERITTKSKNGLYQCPLCGSGTGKNKTGALSITSDGMSWKCFSCNKGGDIFDLVGGIEHIEGFTNRKKRVCEILGIDYQATDDTAQAAAKPKVVAYKEKATDYTIFFSQANQAITQTTYRRGISLATLNRFKVGFVKDWKHPKAPDTVQPSPRLIIPTSKESYLARDTRSTLTDEQKQFSKMKVGTTHLFNMQAFEQDTQPVFLTEGEIDCMSLVDLGAEAAALGSTSMIDRFVQHINQLPPMKQPIILALDNDNAGKKATEELSEQLKTSGIPFLTAELYGQWKDGNERLLNDRDGLKNAILKVLQEAATAAAGIEEQHEQDRATYIEENSNVIALQNFLDEIANSNTKKYPTGFDSLDKALDGGLYPGLYLVGAISSLGKTTLVMQIADYIASEGTDVLIFSLEMSKYELIAKSISRHTLGVCEALDYRAEYAATVRDILDRSRYARFTEKKLEFIRTSIDEYGSYCDHLFINESIGETGIREILAKVNEHVAATGNKPMVIVDYIQILAPYYEKGTDKQNIDKAVLELKRLSRSLNMPVIVISALNRQNYKEVINMAAFRESSSLEYSADCMFGLQLKGAGENGFDEEEAKRQNPRQIELRILKNRNYKTGITLNFNYYPAFNTYREESATPNNYRRR